MDNSFIIVIILVAVIVMYYNTASKQYMSNMVEEIRGNTEHSANIDIKEICQNLNTADKSMNNVPEDDKPLAEQLAEQKKLYNELKLKHEPPEQPRRYAHSELYLVDNEPVGDDVLTSRMMDLSQKGKESLDARSMWSKNSLIPYLEDELQEHEQSGAWWDNDKLEDAF